MHDMFLCGVFLSSTVWQVTTMNDADQQEVDRRMGQLAQLWSGRLRRLLRGARSRRW
jgi:hypothetical protein